MPTSDDVNAQHMAAMGLAEVPLGQPVPESHQAVIDEIRSRCVSTYTTGHGVLRCARTPHTEGSHARGRITWTSGESNEYEPEQPDTGTITKRPREWMQDKGLQMIDPDGWRNSDQSWDDPITEDEFDRLISESTVEHLPVGALGKPMLRHTYQWTGRSPNTCSVTEGDQWCGQGEDAEVHQLRVRSEEEQFEDTDVQKLGRVRQDLGTIKTFPPSERCYATLRPLGGGSVVLWCEREPEHDGEHQSGATTWTVPEGHWSAPTKTREGDQALPKPGQQCVQDLIIAEMEESKRVGLERYGSTLQTFNGRRTIQDVAEEVRDLHVYLKQVEAEAQAERDTLIQVVQDALFEARDEQPAVRQAVRRPVVQAAAEVAVDAIMGWVAGQATKFADGKDVYNVLLEAWPPQADPDHDVIESQAHAIMDRLGIESN